MYKYLKNRLQKDPLTILELGTNHSSYNIEQLAALNHEHQVIIFLCQADNNVCRKRALTRDRQMSPDALERRLNKIFPDEHLTHLQKTGLSFYHLDMNIPLSENIQIIDQILTTKI